MPHVLLPKHTAGAASLNSNALLGNKLGVQKAALPPTKAALWTAHTAANETIRHQPSTYSTPVKRDPKKNKETPWKQNTLTTAWAASASHAASNNAVSWFLPKAKTDAKSPPRAASCSAAVAFVRLLWLPMQQRNMPAASLLQQCRAICSPQRAMWQNPASKCDNWRAQCASTTLKQ